MDRFLRSFLRRGVALAVMGMAVASLASANVPSSDLSNVPNCLGISPTGALTYTVTIIGTGGPIASSAVEIRFTTAGDTLICWCSTVPGPRPRTIKAGDSGNGIGFTNGSGVATFNITAGGCIEYGLAAIPGVLDFAGEVFADNVKMQEVGTVSPDAVDTGGKLPTEFSGGVWNPNGNCAVGLADAVQHTTPLATATYQWCTDINCDLVVGLSDATILTPFLAGAATCVGDAGP
jgi:hypothetical protein